MDMAPLILIMAPILLPIVTDVAGMDPVHVGTMLCLNLSIGLVTSPVANVLFAGIAIGKISIERAMRSTLPFYGALIVVLLSITFVPTFVITLPRLLGA
jgi:TRAP-type C4-dicarboxylate transport system permease large subunit